MKKLIILMTMIALCIQVPLLAVVFDFNADLSLTSNPVDPANPDGTWSYGYIADPNFDSSRTFPYTITLYDATGIVTGTQSQTDCWFPIGDSGWNPLIYHNFEIPGGLYGCPMGQTALHPGPIDGLGTGLYASVARWTAKRAMDNIIVQSSFGAGAGGGVVSCFVIRNGETTEATILKEALGTASVVAYTAVLPNIQANDTIDFIVSAYGEIPGDTTPLQAVITEVTELLAWNPSPADDAVSVPVTTLLSWDAPPGAVNPTYDVYLVATDEDTEPVFTEADLVAADISATQFDPDPDLTLEKHYFWRVDVTVQNPVPQTFTGDVWHFQTEPLPIWNLADAYSGTTNPDTIWSYGMLDYTPGVGPQYLHYMNNHTLPNGIGGAIQFWAWQTAGDRDSYGAVNYNPIDQAISAYGFKWKPYGINIQSATFYALTDSAVVFTAPEASAYSFNATFEDMTDARSSHVKIVRDDMVTVIWDQYVETPVSYSSVLSMAAGEKLYFANASQGVGVPSMVDAQIAAEKIVLTCAIQGEYLPGDVNKDCYVDLADFAQFAQDWLKCNDPQLVGCE